MIAYTWGILFLALKPMAKKLLSTEMSTLSISEKYMSQEVA
jgi:hypothetical protein